jgi:hypothetical protein
MWNNSKNNCDMVLINQIFEYRLSRAPFFGAPEVLVPIYQRTKFPELPFLAFLNLRASINLLAYQVSRAPFFGAANRLRHRGGAAARLRSRYPERNNATVLADT